MVQVTAMESATLNPPISATNWRNPFQIKAPFGSRGKISFKSSRLCSRIISSFKKSDFEEFQGYGRPQRLLPASEVEYFAESLQEKYLESITLNGLQSLYKIKLRTSNIEGSSLSDRNARVLLCFIDGNGDSVLQSIPSCLMNGPYAESENEAQCEKNLFQKGSVDEFIFEGPELDKVQALWISVSSGAQWRLGGVSVTVIRKSQPLSQDVQYDTVRYDFDVEDILLGDGGDKSMVALTPSNITELSGTNPANLLNNSISEQTLGESISKEESMKEYSDLKLSLLAYDAALIFTGTSLSSISAGESSAFAFSLGGFLGFLYLLLVQRSVDELPTEELISRVNSEGNSDGLGSGIKGPLVRFAAILVFSAVAVKFSRVGVAYVLTPTELLVGMVGFLTSKVAVVLAAVKPLPLSLWEKD